MPPLDSVRIDKWLWAARFFKTRALAIKACDIGRVEINGVRAKPAREVRAGSMVHVENEGGIFQIEVLQLSEMRGPAAAAQTLYRETEESRGARLKLAEEHKALQQFAPPPEHRPSKRDRRRIIQFRGRG
jgi:ribosome-associated heat shock protein Hsp15